MIVQSEYEADLLKPALLALLDASILELGDLCAQQVPVVRNKVDVVCVRSRDSTLISLELKKSSWMGAYDQAKRHGAWCHRTYVAVDSRSVPDRYGEFWSILGIGIILTKDRPAKIYKRSPRSTLSSLYLSRLTRAYVREYGYEIRCIL